MSVQHHEFGPFFCRDSRILILGSFPSKKSREQGFYYMHPQNRFWKVLAHLFDVSVPVTLEEKKQLLYQHHIALWDVVESCDIENSSDATIKNVCTTDLNWLLKQTQIKKIYTTGKKAYQLYQKYSKNVVGIDAIPLPSTSSANIANFDEASLMKAYRIIKEDV